MIVNGNLAAPVPAHLNFGKFLLDHLRNAPPNDICLEHYNTGKQLTYKEFAEHAVSVSIALSELGVKKGYIVGIGCGKIITFLPTTLGIVLTGATYTAFPEDIGRAVLSHQLNLSKPSYFICSKLFWRIHGGIIRNLDYIKTIICLDEVEDIELSINKLMCHSVDVESFEPAAVQGQTDVVLITYSSGTTGLSKAVPVTHLSYIVRISPYLLQDEEIKVVHVYGDWHHSYDLCNSYNILTAKKKIIFLDPCLSNLVLKCVNHKQVNAIFTVSCFVGYMAKDKEVEMYDLSSLRLVFSAGSPLDPTYIAMMKKRFPNIQNIIQLYGMSETGELTSERWGLKGPRPGSVGMVAPGVSLKIVDPNTRETLGPYKRGEICVRGSVLMKGYIGVDSTAYLDEQGFLLTGDLGYYDEDKYFFIVGRLKDMICYDGDEVNPLELEKILIQHPDVSETCVVGKPAGDWGEEPAAFVVRAPGARVTNQQLVDYVAKQVSPHMQLRGGVKFVPGLPKDPRGKVQRHQLKQINKKMATTL